MHSSAIVGVPIDGYPAKQADGCYSDGPVKDCGCDCWHTCPECQPHTCGRGSDGR